MVSQLNEVISVELLLLPAALQFNMFERSLYRLADSRLWLPDIKKLADNPESILQQPCHFKYCNLSGEWLAFSGHHLWYTVAGFKHHLSGLSIGFEITIDTMPANESSGSTS